MLRDHIREYQESFDIGDDLMVGVLADFINEKGLSNELLTYLVGDFNKLDDKEGD